ncbi:MAG: protein kinase [Alphaproteobacteria bacterium]|nr:protein kinase [Alphaproteobacteria bacterium]MCB9699197.1 protein kinase [Alphaproteobacteria bacterium]
MKAWGAWRATGRLGSGGMGEVWAVEHVHARVPGALKRPVAMTPALVDTLSHELRMVASLDHPGVVEVLDHGVDPEPWVVFERVDGGSLTPPNTFAELRAILVDVLDALAHAHARGVLHRDLKPANLLRGRDGRVRLADFGIARARDAALDEGADPAGTVAFMAPEQILGAAREQGPPTDLYALACTAWLLATGEPPFPHDPVTGHLGAAPPALEARFPVPDGFEAWLLRGLAKSPRDRFRSAAEAAWALASLPTPSDGEAREAPAATWAPTVTLALTQVPAASLDFRSRREPAPIEVPPLPSDWREGPRPPRLLGVSPSLVGVRPPALVGREAEQDALWAVASAEGPRAALVVGPEGSGRSRLAQWLADRLEECGALVLRTDAERGVAGWLADEPSGPGDLVRRIEAAAGGRRVALCWDEPGEVGGRWMAGLLRAGLPALVLGAGEAPGLEEARRITLGPLPESSRRALVRELLDADEGLAARIDARTGGHPLFAVQLVMALAARRALEAGPTGMRLRAGADAELSDLGDAWAERIDPLASTPDDEQTLVLAALLGHAVDPHELATACAAGGLPDPGPLLVRAREAGVVVGRPGDWRWDHALLRQHLTSRRPEEHARLHAAAAEVVRASPERLAFHLLGAGRTRDALPWLERAAVAAGRGVDQGRARLLCDAWSDALDRLGVARWAPERAELVRRKIGVATDTGRFDVALGLVEEALASVEGWPPRKVGELHLLRANLLERTGRVAEALDACELARAASDELEPRLSLTRGGVLMMAGRAAEAVVAADQGLAAAPDAYLRGELLRVRAGGALRAGRLDEAADAFAEAERAYVEAGATRSAAMIQAEAAAVHHVRGAFDLAEAGYRGALARIDDPGDPTCWHAMINLATVLVLTDRPAEASGWLDRVLPRVRAAGYHNPELFALAARWATRSAGSEWDEDADAVEALQASTGVEDSDFEALARIAAAHVADDPVRSARALAFAEARRRALA